MEATLHISFIESRGLYSQGDNVSVLLKQVMELILAGRKAAARMVDSIQVATCFEIGCRIVEHEQQGSNRTEYGKNLLRDLAACLTSEFGTGLSKRIWSICVVFT